MFGQRNNRIENFSTKQITEIFFLLLPISFIIGNAVVTLNILFFIFLGSVLVIKNKISLNFNLIDFILIFFFIYLILLTGFHYNTPGQLKDVTSNWPLNEKPILKSIFLLRFYFLIFFINILITNKFIDLKKFFFICLICTSFVSLDVIFQYLTGYDFFGHAGWEGRNSGPFGEEWVAGSYISKLSFFSLFAIPLLFKKIKHNKILFSLVAITHMLGIFFSGDRMPLLIFIFGFLLIIIFLKNIRKLMLINLIIFTFIVYIVFNFDPSFQKRYAPILEKTGINKLLIIKNDKSENNYKALTKEQARPEMPSTKESALERDKNLTKGARNFFNTYGSLVQTSYLIWKENKIFGYGLKSFRIKCWEILDRKEYMNLNLNCSTHPHSYYMEIISETGLIGLTTILIFFFLLTKVIFNNLKNIRLYNDEKIYLYIPIIILFFLEIWPLRTSGSFFTAWNGSLFWLVAAMMISIKKNKSS